MPQRRFSSLSSLYSFHLFKTKQKDDISDLDLSKYDIRSVDGALKQYLREQPVSIIPKEHNQSFFKLIEKEGQKEELLEAMQAACSQIPSEVKQILRRLLLLLGTIDAKSNITRMNASNLGVVFAPTLFNLKGQSIQDMQAEIEQSNIAAKVVAYLITNYEKICATLGRDFGIKGYSIFGLTPEFTDVEKELIKAHCTPAVYKISQIILKQGDPNSNIYTFLFLFFILFLR